MEKSLEDRDRVGVQDAVLLENFTSEKAFVENLEKRFKENIIYTYIGQVLISVNPYKELNIYSSGTARLYEKKNFFEAPPHVFAITDTAYRSLQNYNNEQCILISGESGSGKTEASKKVLHYIAEITVRKGKVEEVKDKLLKSNPILEAFGNAKTNRNDNSSRFGKYMDIEFNFEAYPVGGNIINYLLEKSRVIKQISGERNFHIFYQLLAGASDSELEELKLKRNIGNYYYLTNRETDKNDNGDKRDYEEMKKAMHTVGFTSEQQTSMLSIIASVLYMGNIGFGEDEGRSKINKQEPLEIVCELLECDKNELEKALTHRTIEASGDVVISSLNREMAIYARDALAKAVYDRLFSWLVESLNHSLQSGEPRQRNVMGILDIYGFEIFERNSFEQLCINFCNEKLQQLFIELTLKSEQEEYLNEGIEWQNIEFFDNKVICDLIEEKHKGIISLMDEECLRPGEPSDSTLLNKMNKSFTTHQHYISHERADTKLQKVMGRDEFRLIHYAGAVTYNIKNFLEKNNDLLFRDLREAMSNSKNEILQAVFPKEEQKSKKRPETAVTKFKTSLNNLMSTLKGKQPSYIRCIKPNDFKMAGRFDEELVKHQVTYLGLMENLRVRRAGFAYRRTYELFLERYKSLSQSTWPNYKGNAKDGVKILVKSLGYDSEEYRMGKTKIFIRFPRTLFKTEDDFQVKKHFLAAIIQSNWKRYAQRRKYLKMRECVILVQKYVRKFLAIKMAARRRAAANTIRRFLEGFITRNGPVTDLNKDFVEIAKRQWLLRLSKSLPKNILNRHWPACPHACREASALLEKLYEAQLSRIYRQKLTPERKKQLEMKVLAESLFDQKKKSYKASVPRWFVSDRIDNQCLALKQSFVVALETKEKEIYATPVTKYDRHGYKERDRMMIVTNEALYIIEANKSVKQKHRLPLNKIKLLVTNENDKILLVRLPEDLYKIDKGDVIMEVPHVIEACTKIIDVTKKRDMLLVEEKKVIEHYMKQGKQGIIDVKVGNPESVHKDKTGHLLVVAAP